MAVSALNSRIRLCGLSSFEQWHKRDQFSKTELPIKDQDLISLQHNHRVYRNSKSPSVVATNFQTGSIVYIINEKSKHGVRPRYIVDTVDGDWLCLRKLTESQLKSKTYKVHRNACTTVFSSTQFNRPRHSESDSDSDNPQDTCDAALNHSLQEGPISTPARIHVPEPVNPVIESPTTKQSSTSDPPYPQTTDSVPAHRSVPDPVTSTSSPSVPPTSTESPRTTQPICNPMHSSEPNSSTIQRRPRRKRNEPERYGNPYLY